MAKHGGNNALMSDEDWALLLNVYESNQNEMLSYLKEFIPQIDKYFALKKACSIRTMAQKFDMQESTVKSRLHRLGAKHYTKMRGSMGIPNIYCQWGDGSSLHKKHVNLKTSEELEDL